MAMSKLMAKWEECPQSEKQIMLRRYQDITVYLVGKEITIIYKLKILVQMILLQLIRFPE